MERGELDGAGSATLSVLEQQNQDWIQNRKINFLYTIASERTPKLPDVPALPEFGQDELGRTVLKLIGGVTTIGLTLFGPPGIPKERAAALRQAFMDMTKSPEFLADSQKGGFESEPLSGDDLQKFVGDYFNVSDEAKAKLREVVRPMR
jgi:tripartite-type tricarboxylate transporter receptor subunit TctC